jgi:hypothetical protein
LTSVAFLTGTLIAHAAYVYSRDDVRRHGATDGKALSFAMPFVPVVAAFLTFAVVLQTGESSPARPAIAENAPEMAALFAASELDWAVALTALWAVIVPGLLGATFLSHQKSHTSRMFVLLYIIGAALVVCGASLSAKLPVASGAGFLAIAVAGVLIAFARNFSALFAGK